MAITDWNWRLPADVQDYPWDCAACSLAWCLRTIGIDVTEDEVIAGLGPTRISATYGLLDASGAGLVSYCAELGVQAANDGEADFDECLAAAGFQPMLIGGRTWNHWSGVRMGGLALGRADLRAMALMNPSPGWMGVDQLMEEYAFNNLGPFSAVWFESW